jgi:hypothetical protein
MENNAYFKMIYPLVLAEVEKMDKLYGSDKTTVGQHYVFSEGFIHPNTGDHKKQGAPILAYSFIGGGVTHDPTSDSGTRYPMSVIIYGNADSLLPFIQHIHVAKGRQSSLCIGVSTYNNVLDEKTERRSKAAWVFYGSMVYNISSLGKSYVVFYNIFTYSYTKMIAGDTQDKGILPLSVNDSNDSDGAAAVQKAIS